MKVYRIENIDGIGPYTGDLNCDNFEPHWFLGVDHPAPEEDLLLKEWFDDNYADVENHKFGFVSIEQLKEWFHEDRYFKAFHDHEFYLAEYEISEDLVHVGTKQVMFRYACNRFQKKVFKISEIVDHMILQ